MPLLPKDLLKDLEYGDRTLFHLKAPVRIEPRLEVPEPYRGLVLSNPLGQAQAEAAWINAVANTAFQNQIQPGGIV
jgi:hypothetical protein